MSATGTHATPHDPTLSGGCLCGRVRFRLARVTAVTWCDCTTCRKLSGGQGITWLCAARADLVWLCPPRIYRSSPRVERGFCADCGTVLSMGYLDTGEVAVTLPALEAPQAGPARQAE